MTEWRWHGHAAHFVDARNCWFRMTTTVGNVVVSTVGQWHPNGDLESHEIGYRRLFETMVFPVHGALECGCSEITDYTEMDMAGYQTPAEAEAGHMEMCRKWDAKQEEER